MSFRRVLDKITRTGYTSSDIIMFVQEITVAIERIAVVDGAGRALSSLNPDSFSTQRFNFTSSIKLTKNITYHSSKGSGGPKTVSYIETKGNFNSHAHDGSAGDLNTVTYVLPERNLVVDFRLIDGVYHEGDEF